MPLLMIKVDKLIEIFCHCDDFVKQIDKQLILPESGKITRTPQLTLSETMAIVILYHISGMKCFKYYYQHVVKGLMQSYFPDAPSYQRFVAIKHRANPYLHLFLISTRLGELTGIYFGDSTRLPVCHNKRIYQHQVFKTSAKRGKSTMGFFFGFKLHLVINHLGELISFAITAGNVADNNQELLPLLFKNLKGKCYLDKGYLSKLFEQFLDKGLKLVTPIRNNMKNKLMDLHEKLNLKKRGVIETVNGLLKNILNIDHTRHRKPENFLTNTLAALIAYTYIENKPKARISQKHPNVVLI